MKLFYSKESISDLQRLRNFIREKNPDAAKQIGKSIRKGISKLKLFPYLGVKVNKAPDSQDTRDLITSNYIARYLVHNNRIIILRIWHHRENRL
jgi:addiction module RelE/StbE family toxin